LSVGSLHLIVVLSLLAVAWLAPAPAQAQINIVPNGDVEKVDPSNSNLPMYWEYNKWGSGSNAAFVWYNKHTLHTEIFSGSGALPCTYGDAKWWTKAFPIYAGGGKYTVSLKYRSSVKSQVMIQVSLASGGTAYVWVADPPVSSSWTTVSNTVNMPVATKKIRIMHKICATGWVESDNFAMYKGAGPPSDAGVKPDTVWPPPLGDAGSTTPGSDSGATTNVGAMISVAFDDGWLSVHKNGLATMKKQGIRATHFIHSDFVDKTGYQAEFMTPTQLKDLHNAGHEIGSHALNHDDWATNDGYLTASTLDAHLKNSREKLKKYGFNVVGFAPPGGEGIDNLTVQKRVAYYYKYQRSIKWGLNTYPYNTNALKSHIVINTTTLANLKSWIDTAKQQKAWIILLYHRIETPAKYSTQVTPLTFIDQMGVIKASGLPIKPIGEVLGIWKPYSAAQSDGGSSSTSDASTTTSDLSGTAWNDAYRPPVPSPDASQIPTYDLPQRDITHYAMPRPWPLDDDSRCSVTPTSARDLPGLGILLLIGVALLRRRR